MKTTLLVPAAIVLATASSAIAATTPISFDGYCDGVDITLVNNHFAAGANTGCDAGAFGEGIIGRAKINGIVGKWFDFGDNAVALGGGGDQYTYDIQYPFVTGGLWVLFDTTDGVSVTEVNSGTYTVNADGAKGKSGAKSTIPNLHR